MPVRVTISKFDVSHKILPMLATFGFFILGVEIEHINWIIQIIIGIGLWFFWGWAINYSVNRWIGKLTIRKVTLNFGKLNFGVKK